MLPTMGGCQLTMVIMGTEHEYRDGEAEARGRQARDDSDDGWVQQ